MSGKNERRCQFAGRLGNVGEPGVGLVFAERRMIDPHNPVGATARQVLSGLASPGAQHHCGHLMALLIAKTARQAKDLAAERRCHAGFGLDDDQYPRSAHEPVVPVRVRPTSHITATSPLAGGR